MKLTKKKIVILSIIIIILSTFFIPRIVNPFRRSEESIKEYMLKKVPLRTDIDEVIETTKFKSNIQDHRGYNDKKTKDSIGVIHITTSPAKYISLVGFPFYTHVFIDWGFDEERKLVDIQITKEIDAL